MTTTIFELILRSLIFQFWGTPGCRTTCPFYTMSESVKCRLKPLANELEELEKNRDFCSCSCNLVRFWKQENCNCTEEARNPESWNCNTLNNSKTLFPPIIRKRQFVHKHFTILVPLKPTLPNSKVMGFPIEFVLQGPQTELRTLSQNCEQTLAKSGGSLVGVWNGWGYGIAFSRALNFQISEPEIWQKSHFLRHFGDFSWLKDIFQTLENGHSIRYQSIPPLSASRKMANKQNYEQTSVMSSSFDKNDTDHAIRQAPIARALTVGVLPLWAITSMTPWIDHHIDSQSRLTKSVVLRRAWLRSLFWEVWPHVMSKPPGVRAALVWGWTFSWLGLTLAQSCWQLCRELRWLRP